MPCNLQKTCFISVQRQALCPDVKTSWQTAGCSGQLYARRPKRNGCSPGTSGIIMPCDLQKTCFISVQRQALCPDVKASWPTVGCSCQLYALTSKRAGRPPGTSDFKLPCDLQKTCFISVQKQVLCPDARTSWPTAGCTGQLYALQPKRAGCSPGAAASYS